MKLKRMIFIAVLFAIFVASYAYMETKYDPLARYEYVTSENRRVISQYMDASDIEYIVSQQIKPEQFMAFIRIPGFTAKNILYYDLCQTKQSDDPRYIIDFVNKYKDRFTYASFTNLLDNYTYAQLDSFYKGDYTYVENASLASNPSSKLFYFVGNEVAYEYDPKDLIVVNNAQIPSASTNEGGTIYFKAEVEKPLETMLSALQKTNNKINGDLILVRGYVSYEQQVKDYEQALLKYGANKVMQYEDVPGQSEKQLGYTLSFQIPNVSDEASFDASQYTWLKKHAHEYGFILRYPKDKESKTEKPANALTLRYVGVEVAKTMQQNNWSLEEYKEK